MNIRNDIKTSQMYNEGKRGMELRNLVVAEPFSNEQVTSIAEHVMDTYFLKEQLPYVSKINQFTTIRAQGTCVTNNYISQQAMDLVEKVILPELLIRIFMDVNKVEFELAESELKRGPYYDGPIKPHIKKN